MPTLQARVPPIWEKICHIRAWRMGPESESKRVRGMPERRELNPRRALARGREVAVARPLVKPGGKKAFGGSQSQVVFQDAAGGRSAELQFQKPLSVLRLF